VTGANIDNPTIPNVAWHWYTGTPAAGEIVLPIAIYPRATDGFRWATEGTADDEWPAVVQETYEHKEWNFSPINKAIKDMVQALNAAMRYERSSATGSPDREPAFVVREVSNKLVIEMQGTEALTITNGFTSDGWEMFVNGQRLDPSATRTIEPVVYPSRALISPENHPENFDNPWSQSVASSDSLVDINPGDGEVITGMSSFFGVSSVGNANLANILIVFKQHGVYAVDLTPDANRVPSRTVQKLESRGQGCEFPDSIVASDGGIYFANKSGIYRVTRELSIEYVGSMMEGFWRSDVVKSSEMIGYEDKSGQKFKLSVPVNGGSTNSKVIVSDYSRSPGEQLAPRWTTYTNHDVTAWAYNLGESFFSNNSGQVKRLRDEGTKYDYRDESTPIVSTFRFKSTSFGDSGTRARVHRIVNHFDAETDLTNCQVRSYVDMSTTYSVIGTINFDLSTNTKKLYSFSIDETFDSLLYHQIEYNHGTINEKFKLTEIDYKVAGLDEYGIPQPEST
jgi:hypothetical protein